MTLVTIPRLLKQEVPTLYTLRVDTGQAFWEKTLSSEDYTRLADLGTFDGRRTYGFRALLIPIRNHNLSAFLQDLTLPIVFNVALKVDELWLKIIVTCLAVCVDILTLLFRIITAIPRYLYKQPNKENHLFYEFLREKGFDPQLLNKIDCFSVTFLEINKKWIKPTNIFGMNLSGGIWTTHISKEFSVNVVEMSFIYPQFANRSITSVGRGLGTDFYNRCYLNLYPTTTEEQFEELDRVHTELLEVESLLITGPLQEFIEELKVYIPDKIDELDFSKENLENKSSQEILKHVEKAYKAFALIHHPDKGGNAEIFQPINDEWSNLKESFE